MLFDIVSTAFVLVILLIIGKAVWVSTLILDERKKNYRAGTHDYYGNKIEENDDE